MNANGIVGVDIPQSMQHGHIQASFHDDRASKLFEAIHSEPVSESEASTTLGLCGNALLEGRAPLFV